MANFQLTCCSTADLTQEHFTKIGVEWTPFHFTMDGKSYPDNLGLSMPLDVFYKKIEEGAMPTTSQANVDQFLTLWEGFLQNGLDILHISLSTGLSGVYNSACTARDDLAKKYPDRKIMVLDSLGGSNGCGLMLDTAAKMRDDGKSMEEIYSWLEKNRLRLHHWFFSTDLTHYKRGGRISASSAVIGTLLQICPLMDVNCYGRLTTRAKIRGKKNVIKEIAKMMELHAENGNNYDGKCFISHSNCLKDAQEVARLIEEKFPKLNGKVLINNIGTVIGSHTGPGTVSMYFWGDERVE